MTQEEKAKAYDEALEKARQLCAYPTTKPFISDLQDLFPELAESEDERIRKVLIDYFDSANKVDENPLMQYGIQTDKVITWLKRQGEHKPAEWSEEDEEQLRFCCAAIELSNYYYSNDEYRDCAISFLKSLKGRIQSKQKEWSEWDRILQDSSISYLCNLRDTFETKGWDKEQILKCINWLQSLRPQSHWKPSEEQITWLYRAADDASKDSRMKQILNELLSDLKKLKK